jgi:transaldolase
MAENSLVQLNKVGQSVWLDTVSRKIINSGHLKKLVTEDGVSGVTSNPTIFHKAISGSDDYDEALRELLGKGMSDPKQLFMTLAIKDISDAADILYPVYKETGGNDGFVSIEVSPDLAYKTEATIKEAREIHEAIGKKNILIKVPATREGVPAINQLLSEGINVNVTLLFSVQRYLDVTEAYLDALEERADSGKPINEVTSVASFFVSRVDTLTDKLLLKSPNKAKAEKLRGLAAVANAKMSYWSFMKIYSTNRFEALKESGAKVQRLLWASTGTKNPDYSDIKYVEELIAPDSVNTMPEPTIDAFRDHGNVRISIEDDMETVKELYDELKTVGVDLMKVTNDLEEEGVKLFADSYFALLDDMAKKRDELK